MIQDENPYESPTRALLNPKVWSGNIDTAWGNLFEELLMRYVSKEKDVEMLGENIFIPHTEYTCYSPDALGVMLINDEYKRVLFEFKNPFRRLIKDEIPIYYVPQTKMGMDIIPVVDAGCHIEAMFRKCSFEQCGLKRGFDTKSYGHTGIKTDPIAFGIIGFLDNTGNKSKDKSIDIGSDLCPKEFFESILMGTVEGKYTAVYGNILSENDDFLKVLEMEKMHKNENFVAYLPWKLLKVNYHIVDKIEGYLLPWMEKIKDYCVCQRNMQKEEDLDKKKNIANEFIEKYYGQIQ
jgi:hypothetical protein